MELVDLMDLVKLMDFMDLVDLVDIKNLMNLMSRQKTGSTVFGPCFLSIIQKCVYWVITILHLNYFFVTIPIKQFLNIQ